MHLCGCSFCIFSNFRAKPGPLSTLIRRFACTENLVYIAPTLSYCTQDLSQSSRRIGHTHTLTAAWINQPHLYTHLDIKTYIVPPGDSWSWGDAGFSPSVNTPIVPVLVVNGQCIMIPSRWTQKNMSTMKDSLACCNQPVLSANAPYPLLQPLITGDKRVIGTDGPGMWSISCPGVKRSDRFSARTHHPDACKILFNFF